MSSGEFGYEGGIVFGWDGGVYLAETFVTQGLLHDYDGFVLHPGVKLLFGCGFAAGEWNGSVL